MSSPLISTSITGPSLISGTITSLIVGFVLSISITNSTTSDSSVGSSFTYAFTYIVVMPSSVTLIGPVYSSQVTPS